MVVFSFAKPPSASQPGSMAPEIMCQHSRLCPREGLGNSLSTSNEPCTPLHIRTLRWGTN